MPESHVDLLPQDVAPIRGAGLIRFLNSAVPLGRRYHPVLGLLNPRHGLVSVPFGAHQLLQPAIWRKQLTNYLLYGERFLPELRLLADLVREVSSGVVLDVGANVGMYTLFLRSVTNLPIVSYEPQPFLCQLLRWNVEFNRLRDVQVRNLALGEQEADLFFSLGINGAILPPESQAVAHDQSASETGRDNLDAQAERVRRGGEIARVHVTSLDRDLAASAPVGLIKMDIEGFEDQALRGAARIIEEQRPRLFVEIHPKQLLEFGSSCEAVLDRLRPFYALEFWHFGRNARVPAEGRSSYPDGYRHADERAFLAATRNPARHTQDFIVGRPLQ